MNTAADQLEIFQLKGSTDCIASFGEMEISPPMTISFRTGMTTTSYLENPNTALNRNSFKTKRGNDKLREKAFDNWYEV